MMTEDAGLTVIAVLAMALIAISAFNAYTINGISGSIIGTGSSESAAAGDALSYQQAQPSRPAVTATVISDSSCTACFDMGVVVDAMLSAGVNITGLDEVTYGTEEASSLITGNGIRRIPSLILSEGIMEYERVASSLAGLNVTRGMDGFVLGPVQPPYIDIATGNVTGLVDMIKLVDRSCSACYNVSLNNVILERLGLAIGSELTYDIGSAQGRALAAKYSITLVPTVVLSPAASEYMVLGQIWEQVGTIEDDGWFVLRNLSSMGTHKNIATKEIINMSSGSGA